MRIFKEVSSEQREVGVKNKEKEGHLFEDEGRMKMQMFGGRSN